MQLRHPECIITFFPILTFGPPSGSVFRFYEKARSVLMSSHIDYVNIACSNFPTDKETESQGREVTYATQQVMGRSPQTVGPPVQNRCLLTSSLKKLTENCQQAHHRYKNLTAEVF